MFGLVGENIPPRRLSTFRSHAISCLCFQIQLEPAHAAIQPNIGPSLLCLSVQLRTHLKVRFVVQEIARTIKRSWFDLRDDRFLGSSFRTISFWTDRLWKCMKVYIDFSTLYTILPHNLIKDKLVDLVEFFKEKVLFILHVMIGMHFCFTSDTVRNYNSWSCKKVYEAFTFLSDNIYVRFGS